jgi:repressor LexA
MEPVSLTKRQKQVLDFIQEEMIRNGYPPTVREIGEALGLSSSATVHTHLATLEAKGYLKRDGAKSRSLTLTAIPTEEQLDCGAISDDLLRRSTISLPLVGHVAAGSPILAEQNIEQTFTLPKEIVGDTSSFLLRVKGDSMIEAGIFSGDYVVVREQSTAANGDIVVALIDEEATVKTFYREKDSIRLQPENSSMEPIFSRDVVILGKVVALFRSL